MVICLKCEGMVGGWWCLVVEWLVCGFVCGDECD